MRKESKIEKIKEKLKDVADPIYPAYILYFYDVENLHADLIGIESLDSIVIFKKRKEIYKLEAPAFYIGSKPVFVLMRRSVSSLKIENREILDEELKLIPASQRLFVRKSEKELVIDEDPSILHAAVESSWWNLILRKKTDAQSILINILIALTSFMLGLIIAWNSMPKSLPSEVLP